MYWPARFIYEANKKLLEELPQHWRRPDSLGVKMGKKKPPPQAEFDDLTRKLIRVPKAEVEKAEAAAKRKRDRERRK
jgi:hypothetical protein